MPSNQQLRLNGRDELISPLTADIVLKALRTLKVRIPDKFSTPGSIVI